MEVVVRKNLSDKWKTIVRVPYALRRVPDESLSRLLPWSGSLVPGDIALARVEKLGRNDSVELRDGRRCSLHKGDLLAVVFGNRYATRQFEGYARADGEHCDLLSMGGMCGLVVSKHAECGDPTRLQLLGFIGDPSGSPLHLRQFAIPPSPCNGQPGVRVVVVCGASMDSGKTHTAMSVIAGIHKQGYRGAGATLTGTAAGKDRFKLLDAAGGDRCAQRAAPFANRATCRCRPWVHERSVPEGGANGNGIALPDGARAGAWRTNRSNHGFGPQG